MTVSMQLLTATRGKARTGSGITQQGLDTDAGGGLLSSLLPTDIHCLPAPCIRAWPASQPPVLPNPTPVPPPVNITST